MTTDDQRADFDDEFGARRQPWTVTWAAVFWLIFAIFNVAIVAVVELLPDIHIDSSLDAVTSPVFSAFLAGLYSYFGFRAFRGKASNLKAGLYFSWFLGISFGSLATLYWYSDTYLTCRKGWLLPTGSGSTPAVEYFPVVLLFAYFLPLLSGAILATIGRRDYAR